MFAQTMRKIRVDRSACDMPNSSTQLRNECAQGIQMYILKLSGIHS